MDGESKKTTVGVKRRYSDLIRQGPSGSESARREASPSLCCEPVALLARLRRFSLVVGAAFFPPQDQGCNEEQKEAASESESKRVERLVGLYCLILACWVESQFCGGGHGDESASDVQAGFPGPIG